MSINKIQPCDDRIKTAEKLRPTWTRFHNAVETICANETGVGVFAAWNGGSCDVAAAFELTKLTDPEHCKMPPSMLYFWDPMKTVKNYTGNSLNAAKSGVSGYGLAVMYCHVSGEVKLDGAHDSMIDALAQAQVCEHADMRKYFDKPNGGVELMTEVFSKKFDRKREQAAELKRKVPAGYIEDDPAVHTPPEHFAAAAWDSDHPPQLLGPTRKAREAETLIDLFYLMFPKRVQNGDGTVNTTKFSLDMMAKQSNAYGNEDPVQEYVHGERSMPSYKVCPEGAQNARKRFKPKRTGGKQKRGWINFTAGSILSFLGIMIGMCAIGTRTLEQVWSNEYATSVPWMQNAMHNDAFKQHLRYLHFVDNTAVPKKGDHGWSPTFKVDPVLLHFNAVFKLLWTLGRSMSIDESMIRYSGRAIAWVQYMPAKPIKHGIKLFVLCCSITAYCFAFEVYTGASEEMDGSRLGIISRLLENGEFEKTPGRIMYTDNYYTSLEVMAHLWSTYKMFLVGTFRMQKKKSTTAVDFAFHKLSAASLKLCEGGWQRRATRLWPRSVTVRWDMWYQCITLKDRAQVGILTNMWVWPRTATDPKLVRRTKGGKIEIESHPAILWYNYGLAGVDHLDRSISDFGMSRRTSRWYMRIAFWVFDAAVHNMWQIVSAFAEAAEGPGDKFYEYKGKNKRIKFQFDLAQALIAEGIRLGKAENGGKKPKWMRQVALAPCPCKKCYFCLHEKDAMTAATSPAEKVQDICEANDHQELAAREGRCVVCFRKATVKFPTLTRTGLMQKSGVRIARTKFGCAGCTERSGQKAFVCAEHWADYDHKWLPLGKRNLAVHPECSNCGFQLRQGAKFCDDCGKKQ